MGAVAGSSTMKTIAVILVVWAVASARGRTMKDKTTPTPIPPASAEDPDPTQEIARLRAEILEVRKELQATTEVPRWFQKWKDEQETTTEVPVWFRNWKDQQATAKEGPMWFQKWKEETEGKRKPDSSKNLAIKVATSKLVKDILSAIISG